MIVICFNILIFLLFILCITSRAQSCCLRPWFLFPNLVLLTVDYLLHLMGKCKLVIFIHKAEAQILESNSLSDGADPKITK